MKAVNADEVLKILYKYGQHIFVTDYEKYRDLQDEIANLKEIKPEPCKDYVSRQAVLNLIEHYNSDSLGSVFFGYDNGVKFADEVNKLPSVTPQKYVGHWIPAGYYHAGAYDDIYYVTCSCCREDSLEEGDYCPNCGAKMLEPQEREE